MMFLACSPTDSPTELAASWSAVERKCKVSYPVRFRLVKPLCTCGYHKNLTALTNVAVKNCKLEVILYSNNRDRYNINISCTRCLR